MRQESKHEIIATLRGRYRAAGRVEKGRIIAEVVLVTGYDPRYAQTLLREGGPVSEATSASGRPPADVWARERAGADGRGGGHGLDLREAPGGRIV